MDLQPYVEPIVDLITSRTKTIIVLFLVLSVIFTAGLGNISTESGTEQFTTDLPSEKALQEINQEFIGSLNWSDNNHPTPKGTKLIANCIYKSIIKFKILNFFS